MATNDPTAAVDDAALDHLRHAVRLAAQAGVSQNWIARHAGITNGRVSQIMTQGVEGSRPRPLTMRGLVRALLRAQDEVSAVADVEAANKFAAHLDALATTFDVARESSVEPGRTVPADSPVYVTRACDAELRNSGATRPGWRAIVGGFRTGRSTFARAVYQSALTSSEHAPAFVDCAALDAAAMSEAAYLATVVNGVSGAALTEDSSAVDFDAAITDWIGGGRTIAVVVLDGANIGTRAQCDALRRLLRGWDQKASSPVPADRPFARLSVWSVLSTYGIPDPRDHSITDIANMACAVIATPWFERSQVTALERQLGVPSAARGMAWDLFRGQPHLVHLYTHLAATGELRHDQDPAQHSGFGAHLDALAATVATDEIVAGAVAALAGNSEPDLPVYSPFLHHLGVTDRRGSFACPFYRDELPYAVLTHLGDPHRAAVR